MNNVFLFFFITTFAALYVVANEIMELQNINLATSSQIIRLNQVAEKLLSAKTKTK